MVVRKLRQRERNRDLDQAKTPLATAAANVFES